MISLHNAPLFGGNRYDRDSSKKPRSKTKKEKDLSSQPQKHSAQKPDLDSLSESDASFNKSLTPPKIRNGTTESEEALFKKPTTKKHKSVSDAEEQKKNIELWDKLLRKWDMTNPRILQCAQSLVKRQPIPGNLRCEAWYLMSGARNIKMKSKYSYAELHTSESRFKDRIEKDLPRTFGNYPGFIEKQGSIDVLRRMLVAYSILDKELGYCQGMNYIAAFLIHQFKNEERAFWTFVSILHSKRYYIRSLFLEGLPGYAKCEAVFLQLLEHHLPALHEHFQELTCVQAVLPPWLHSLFAYPSVSPDVTCYIWDLFLLNDISILISVSFMICLVHVKRLLKCDFVALVNFCKSKDFLTLSVVERSLTVKLNREFLASIYTLYDDSMVLFDKQKRRMRRRNSMDREFSEREAMRIQENLAKLHTNTENENEKSEESERTQDHT